MLHFSDIGTLGDIARVHGRSQPDKVAFVFESRETTFGELDMRSNQVASGFQALGLEAGARVCHLGKNSSDYFEVLFGCAKSGVVMTPLNWRLALPELVYIVSDCDARVMFFGREFAAAAQAVRTQVGPQLILIALEGPVADALDYQSWRDDQSIDDAGLEIASEAVAVQLYTSGTTGRPKGALLAHGAFLGLQDPDLGPRGSWQGWTEDDVSLLAMPVGHIGGTGWGFMGVYAGAKAVVMREFDPDQVLEHIQRDRVSKIFMVPAAMQIIVRRPRAREIDWSCVKYMLYGASPIPLELLKECMGVFGCGFVQLYGMTETCGTIVALAPEDHDPAGSPRMRSAGQPLPGVEVAILDEGGARMDTGMVGEIAVRSRANMSGYWKLEAASAEAIDANAWLRTGDAGYLDDQGYLYIHDRVKDMIITGGENVYPAEVESAIYGHPGVADVAVIGIPDQTWGESIAALVVKAQGVDVSAEEVIAWARQRIAAFKAPRRVDFVDALPRNASGKILRRVLREPYWDGAPRRVG